MRIAVHVTLNHALDNAVLERAMKEISQLRTVLVKLSVDLTSIGAALVRHATLDGFACEGIVVARQGFDIDAVVASTTLLVLGTGLDIRQVDAKDVPDQVHIVAADAVVYIVVRALSHALCEFVTPSEST